jgi:regulatory protein
VSTPEEERLFASALRILTARQHSAFELRRKLFLRGAEKDTAERIIEHLAELDLINDEKFARDFIEYAFLRKSWGNRKVKAALMQRGIDREFIDTLLSAPEAAEMERQAAERFVNKSAGRGRLKREGKEKLVAQLLSRGFGWDVVSPIIGDLDLPAPHAIGDEPTD